MPSGRLKIDGDRKNMPYLLQAPCHFSGITRNFGDGMQVIDLQYVNYIQRDEACFDHDPTREKRFSLWDAARGFLPSQGKSETGPGKHRGSWLSFPEWLRAAPKYVDPALRRRSPAHSTSIVPVEGMHGLGQRPYNSRRPSMALSMVISSAYSMSLPTGIPIAMRVTLSPARRSCPER